MAKGKMGRPRNEVDVDLLKRLARIHCTYEEMASILKVSADTLERHFADIINEAKAEGQMSLKRKQMELALQGNVTMLIWLGKILLKQKDETAYKFIKQNAPIEVQSSQTKELMDEFKGLLQAKFSERT